jgi:hypothetical protein
MQYTVFAAQSGVRAPYVDEDGECRYAPIIGWLLDELETGEKGFKAIVHDGEIPSESIILQDSQYLAGLCFDGERLSSEEIAHYTKRVRRELEREAEFQEKSHAMRKQIAAILFASHPEPRSKAELLESGIVYGDKILLPILGVLKKGGLIEELSGGKYRLTERGVEQAKASAGKAS